MTTDVHEAASEEAAVTDGQPITKKEVRYALVLNGGVSLAVWMGGVTHELNQLRLASENDESTSVWRKILEAAGRKATIDLVAGTSAGGLNGTVLATAIARGGDMPNMRERWAKMASLEVGELTHEDPKTARSVLDGERFKERLAEVLGEIEHVDAHARECTLFTTATALDSRTKLKLPDGRMVDTADGRRVYKFVRRNAINGTDAINHFARDDADTLVTAARATAAFPIAFEPVEETLELRQRQDPPAPKKPRRPLVDGDALDNAPDELRTLVDGGVLDNAPFEPLLRALRERPIDQPYERMLLYVTPGVTAKNAEPGNSQRSLDSILQGVLAASREPDERLDVDALKQTFELMGVTSALPHRIIADYLSRSANAVSAADLEAAADKLLELYRRGRAESLQRKLEHHSENSPLRPPGDVRLLPGDVPGGSAETLKVGPEWQWGAPTADRLLRWWGRALSALSDQNRADYTAALSKIAHAQRVVTDIRAQLVGAIEEAPLNRPSIGTQDDSALDSLRDLYRDHDKRILEAVNDSAQAVGMATGHNAAEVLEYALAVEVVGFALNWGGAEYDPPRFRYQNLTPEIKPPSILDSPATQSAKWPGWKLYGERWSHFGAFASRSGREHDWLWGRIDGATALARGLLAQSEIAESDADVLCENLIREVLHEEGRAPETVLKDAARMSGLNGTALLGLLLHDDAGRKSLEHLERTAWALIPQFKSLEKHRDMLRAALARKDWSSGTNSFSWKFVQLAAIRVWAKPARVYLDRKLNHLADSARAEAHRQGFV